MGRSRGGLTVKTHLATERRCRPLAFVVTPGQAADSPRFEEWRGLATRYDKTRGASWPPRAPSRAAELNRMAFR